MDEEEPCNGSGEEMVGKEKMHEIVASLYFLISSFSLGVKKKPYWLKYKCL